MISWVGSGWVYLGRVGLVWGMQQVEACRHSLGFGYKGETCEPQSVLATGVRTMSLWPLITVSNIGAWLCLDVV
jgi:hypothetical protein